MMSGVPAHPVSFSKVAVPEDDMELGSDNGRNHIVEDIDIDFELTDTEIRDDDNDYIIDDAQSEADGEMVIVSDKPQDDVMQDEDTLQDAHHDNNSTADEVLLNVGEIPQDAITDRDELGDETQESSDPTIRNEAIISMPVPVQDGESHDLAGSSDPINESFSNVVATEPSQEQVLPVARDSAQSEYTNAATQQRETEESVQEFHSDKEDDSDQGPNDNHSPREHLTEHTTAEAQTADGAQPLEEHTAVTQETRVYEDHVLHPVIVDYDGTQMSLFPPSDDDDGEPLYFLEDRTLARESLSMIFQAFRTVLADTITDGDELVISINGLGLYAREDSIHAASTSLADILGVYVQLLKQDGVDNPEPLYIGLSLETRFSKRLSDLLSGAAEGKGYSQLSFWDLNSSEDDGDEDQQFEVGKFDDEVDNQEEQSSASKRDTEAEEFSNDTDVPVAVGTDFQSAQASHLSDQGLDEHGQWHGDSHGLSYEQGHADQLEVVSSPHGVDVQQETYEQEGESDEATEGLLEGQQEEEDLIDYEDGDDDQLRNEQNVVSSGSSTLQGDDGHLDGDQAALHDDAVDTSQNEAAGSQTGSPQANKVVHEGQNDGEHYSFVPEDQGTPYGNPNEAYQSGKHDGNFSRGEEGEEPGIPDDTYESHEHDELLASGAGAAEDASSYDNFDIDVGYTNTSDVQNDESATSGEGKDDRTERFASDSENPHGSPNGEPNQEVSYDDALLEAGSPTGSNLEELPPQLHETEGAEDEISYEEDGPPVGPAETWQEAAAGLETQAEAATPSRKRSREPEQISHANESDDQEIKRLRSD